MRLILYPLALGLIALAWRQHHATGSSAAPAPTSGVRTDIQGATGPPVPVAPRTWRNDNWIGPYPPGLDAKSGGLPVQATTIDGRLTFFYGAVMFSCGERLRVEAIWPLPSARPLVHHGRVASGWEQVQVSQADGGLFAATATVRMLASITTKDPHPVVVLSIRDVTRTDGKPTPHPCHSRVRYSLHPDPNR